MDITVTARRRWRITAVASVVTAVVMVMCLVLMLMKTPGMHFAFFLVAALLALIVAYLALWSLGAHPKLARAANTVRRGFAVCLLIAAVGFASLEIVIIAGAKTEERQVDCVIILGAGISGETPQLTLVTRLNAAIEFLKTQGDIPIIVSGGQGPGESITEAEAMLRYLVKRGISEERIYKEDASASTWENFVFSCEVMEQIGLEPENIKTAVVTNEFHVFRSKMIADRVGLDASGVAAGTPLVRLKVLYYCREAFALVKSFVFDK